jgi:hypothetical protein
VLGVLWLAAGGWRPAGAPGPRAPGRSIAGAQAGRRGSKRESWGGDGGRRWADEGLMRGFRGPGMGFRGCGGLRRGW